MPRLNPECKLLPELIDHKAGFTIISKLCQNCNYEYHCWGKIKPVLFCVLICIK